MGETVSALGWPQARPYPGLRKARLEGEVVEVLDGGWSLRVDFGPGRGVQVVELEDVASRRERAVLQAVPGERAYEAHLAGLVDREGW